MKILSVSDTVNGLLYSPQIKNRFKDVDLVISCGDLPFYYLEYIISMLNAPLYYVHGNHTCREEQGHKHIRNSVWGGINLHRKCKRDASGLLLAGIEGSLQYNQGPYQYSQSEMWSMVLSLMPTLFMNKIMYGRYLDIFVTHAAAWHIHDTQDLPHQGIKAFCWLHRVFKPAYHLHGHIHIYRQDTTRETRVNDTRVINVFNYRELEVETRR